MKVSPWNLSAVPSCVKKRNFPFGETELQYNRTMNLKKPTIHVQKRRLIPTLVLTTSLLIATQAYVFAQNKSDFPDGYDAVQAAPKSHRVIFENALVRVLEVSVSPSGSTEPMHHHRWPSFFLSWDTGGSTPHVRYHRANGSVIDQPSQQSPSRPRGLEYNVDETRANALN